MAVKKNRSERGSKVDSPTDSNQKRSCSSLITNENREQQACGNRAGGREAQVERPIPEKKQGIKMKRERGFRITTG